MIRKNKWQGRRRRNLLDHLGFGHDLDGVHVARFLLTGKVHPCEAASSDGLNELKVVDGEVENGAWPKMQQRRGKGRRKKQA